MNAMSQTRKKHVVTDLKTLGKRRFAKKHRDKGSKICLKICLKLTELRYDFCRASAINTCEKKNIGLYDETDEKDWLVAK
jgi:hypothetical protein